MYCLKCSFEKVNNVQEERAEVQRLRGLLDDSGRVSGALQEAEQQLQALEQQLQESAAAAAVAVQRATMAEATAAAASGVESERQKRFNLLAARFRKDQSDLESRLAAATEGLAEATARATAAEQVGLHPGLNRKILDVLTVLVACTDRASTMSMRLRSQAV